MHTYRNFSCRVFQSLMSRSPGVFADVLAGAVRRLDAALQGHRWEAVFVDDDSPDGTAAEVRAAAQADAPNPAG